MGWCSELQTLPWDGEYSLEMEMNNYERRKESYVGRGLSLLFIYLKANTLVDRE